MLKMFVMLIVAFALSSAVSASNRDEFCDGFEVGYKTAKGNNMVIVPICPIPAITPLGSSDYQEGIKAGMRAASR